MSKQEQEFVASVSYDVKASRLPEQTLTRKEYMRLGGVPVTPQIDHEYDSQLPNGIHDGNTFGVLDIADHASARVHPAVHKSNK